MAWSGGRFFRVISGGWTTDKAANPVIVASRHDTNDDDLADGIDACIAKDGSNSFTGDIDAGSHSIKALAGIEVDNNKWLSFKDSSGILQNVLQMDSSDDVRLSTAFGQDLYFAIGGFNKWAVDSSGDFLPVTDSTFDIGSASLRVNEISTNTIDVANNSSIRWRDSGGTAQHVLYLDSGDITKLNAPIGKSIDFTLGLSSRLEIMDTTVGHVNFKETLAVATTPQATYLPIRVNGVLYYLRLWS